MMPSTGLKVRAHWRNHVVAYGLSTAQVLLWGFFRSLPFYGLFRCPWRASALPSRDSEMPWCPLPSAHMISMGPSSN